MTTTGAKTRRAGVLGGMGPEATVSFLQKFYTLSRGRPEQARPALLVSINPEVPDRNQAWRDSGPTPAPVLVQMGRQLKQAGADFCVITCITAHGYVDTFQKDVGLPLLRIPDVVADALSQRSADSGSVGLLATTTTLEMQLFQHAFAARNIPLLVPDRDDQETLMHAIYAIKIGQDARVSTVAVANALIAGGARTLLLGCTDLSILSPMNLGACIVIDALDLLAERTLAEIESKVVLNHSFARAL